MADCNCCEEYIVSDVRAGEGGYTFYVAGDCENLCDCIEQGSTIHVYNTQGVYQGDLIVGTCIYQQGSYTIIVIGDTMLDDGYTFRTDAICSSAEFSLVVESEVAPVHSIVEKECDEYKLISSEETFILYVQNLITGVVLYDNVVTDTDTIITLDDGIYSVKMDDEQFYILVLCDMWDCFEKMFLYITCTDRKNCCDPMDENDAKVLENYKNEINKLLLLYNMLLIRTGYTEFKSVFNIGEENIDAFTDIGLIQDVWTKIREILERCGCTDDEHELETTECE